MTPDEIRPNAHILILGQSPGQHEESGERLIARAGKAKSWEPCRPAPFLGDSGYDLERTYLPLAGLVREDVSLGNAVRCRLEGSNKLLPLDRVETRAAIKHCQAAYGVGLVLPDRHEYVIALGEYALWATTGEDGGDPPPYEISRKIAGWRGWTLPWSPFQRRTHTDIWTPPGSHSSPQTPQPGAAEHASETAPFSKAPEHAGPISPIVYVTLHPASVYEAPWLRPAVLRDWQKFGELLAGRWPSPLPPIQRRMKAWPREFSFDTEFWEQGQTQRLVRWSASDGESVWCVEAGTVLPTPPIEPPLVVMHQADADIDRLDEFFGGTEVLHEDTMYAHHSLHSELAHGLDFLGSLYARTNRWKHLVSTNPITYSAADAYGTWDVWQALRGELGRDPQTEVVYRTCLLPLLRIVAKARRVGIRVDAGRARDSVRSLRDAQDDCLLRAAASAGWPLNLNSGTQVGAQGYGLEKWRG